MCLRRVGHGRRNRLLRRRLNEVGANRVRVAYRDIRDEHSIAMDVAG
jgi:hypothetical protein